MGMTVQGCARFQVHYCLQQPVQPCVSRTDATRKGELNERRDNDEPIEERLFLSFFSTGSMYGRATTGSPTFWHQGSRPSNKLPTMRFPVSSCRTVFKCPILKQRNFRKAEGIWRTELHKLVPESHKHKCHPFIEYSATVFVNLLNCASN
jgi:hypothetical protein